jgi:pSer/pThr/pTyr-binding forkhead associated (FHA) protein
VLKLNNQRIFITDLGSSNGTRVNGQKIMPNVDYPLNHGDVIALGKFKIQVLIRK